MIVSCREATNTSNAIADNVQRQHLQCYRGQHPYLEPKCYCTYAKTLKFQVEATTSICGPKNGGLWRRAVYCTVLHVRTMGHHAAFRLVFLDSKWLSACMYIYVFVYEDVGCGNCPTLVGSAGRWYSTYMYSRCVRE